MTPRRKILLEVVDHEEFVEVDERRDDSGRLIEARPKEGTRQAFLHLQGPDGMLIRAEIPAGQLDPILALLYPDFGGHTG
jgi:hypothetical protein